MCIRDSFTSESVSEGHPDKVSDRISDMVVDSYLSGDPFSRVACETLTTTNKVVLAGEVRGPEIKKGELIETVEFPIPEKSSYVKFPNPASRYAIVGVYVAKFKNEVRVSVTGAGSHVFRIKELEEALQKDFSYASVDNVKISSKELNSDIHASADYRAHIISVMTKKAISSC